MLHSPAGIPGQLMSCRPRHAAGRAVPRAHRIRRQTRCLYKKGGRIEHESSARLPFWHRGTLRGEFGLRLRMHCSILSSRPTAGVMKDTINMTRFSTVEIDFVADDPGLTLLHCHHQDHQDEGFMGMVTYL
jgi:hypothetical protein